MDALRLLMVTLAFWVNADSAIEQKTQVNNKIMLIRIIFKN
jgi:hypothetical protein